MNVPVGGVAPHVHKVRLLCIIFEVTVNFLLAVCDPPCENGGYCIHPALPCRCPVGDGWTGEACTDRKHIVMYKEAVA